MFGLFRRFNSSIPSNIFSTRVKKIGNDNLQVFLRGGYGCCIKIRSINSVGEMTCKDEPNPPIISISYKFNISENDRYPTNEETNIGYINFKYRNETCPNQIISNKIKEMVENIPIIIKYNNYGFTGDGPDQFESLKINISDSL